jgi:hypothetical protein
MQSAAADMAGSPQGKSFKNFTSFLSFDFLDLNEIEKNINSLVDKITSIFSPTKSIPHF